MYVVDPLAFTEFRPDFVDIFKKIIDVEGDPARTRSLHDPELAKRLNFVHGGGHPVAVVQMQVLFHPGENTRSEGSFHLNQQTIDQAYVINFSQAAELLENRPESDVGMAIQFLLDFGKCRRRSRAAYFQSGDRIRSESDTANDIRQAYQELHALTAEAAAAFCKREDLSVIYRVCDYETQSASELLGRRSQFEERPASASSGSTPLQIIRHLNKSVGRARFSAVYGPNRALGVSGFLPFTHQDINLVSLINVVCLAALLAEEDPLVDSSQLEDVTGVINEGVDLARAMNLQRVNEESLARIEGLLADPELLKACSPRRFDEVVRHATRSGDPAYMTEEYLRRLQDELITFFSIATTIHMKCTGPSWQKLQIEVLQYLANRPAMCVKMVDYLSVRGGFTFVFRQDDIGQKRLVLVYKFSGRGCSQKDPIGKYAKNFGKGTDDCWARHVMRVRAIASIVDLTGVRITFPASNQECFKGFLEGPSREITPEIIFEQLCQFVEDRPHERVLDIQAASRNGSGGISLRLALSIKGNTFQTEAVGIDQKTLARQAAMILLTELPQHVIKTIRRYPG